MTNTARMRTMLHRLYEMDRDLAMTWGRLADDQKLSPWELRIMADVHQNIQHNTLLVLEEMQALNDATESSRNGGL